MTDVATQDALVASAPGKVVLSGEYAVLDGAPAIAMAIDRRAQVTLGAERGDYCNVTSAGYSDQVGRFDTRESPLHWIENAAPYSLLDAVWNASSLTPSAMTEMRLDTESFRDLRSGVKLGLGSSAALCVALVAALRNDTANARHAFAAHRSFQAGRGSGVDVACSITGGLLRYQMEGHSSSPIEWPAGLSYRLLWSGIAADTRNKLARLSDAGGIGLASRAALNQASAEMAECWMSGDAASIVASNRGYNDVLQRFDIEHQLGIFDGGHAAMHALANAANIVYKPCGAGGGDVGVLLSTDAEALKHFVAGGLGQFRPLDCRLDRSGVAIEYLGNG